MVSVEKFALLIVAVSIALWPLAGTADEEVCYRIGVVQICGLETDIGVLPIDDSFLNTSQPHSSVCSAEIGFIPKIDDPIRVLWRHATTEPWVKESFFRRPVSHAIEGLDFMIWPGIIERVCNADSPWFDVHIDGLDLTKKFTANPETVHQCLQQLSVDKLLEALPNGLKDLATKHPEYIRLMISELQKPPPDKIKMILDDFLSSTNDEQVMSLVVDQFFRTLQLGLRYRLTAHERSKKIRDFEFNVVVIPTNQTCSPSIHRSSGRLYVPDNIYTLPISERRAIIYHEYGHLYYELFLKPALEVGIREALIMFAQIKFPDKLGLSYFELVGGKDMVPILEEYGLYNKSEDTKNERIARSILTLFFNIVLNLEPESTADLIALYGLRASPRLRSEYVSAMILHVPNISIERTKLMESFSALLDEDFTFQNLAKVIFDNYPMLLTNGGDGSEKLKKLVCDNYPSLPVVSQMILRSNAHHVWDTTGVVLNRFRNDTKGEFDSIPVEARRAISDSIFDVVKIIGRGLDQIDWHKMRDEARCNVN